MKDNWVIFTIVGGFYFFGNEVEAPEGYVALTQCSMFRGFQGRRGLPGVASGAENATVTLDRFKPESIQIFPLTSLLAIFQSINLYEYKGTTLG